MGNCLSPSGSGNLGREKGLGEASQDDAPPPPKPKKEDPLSAAALRGDVEALTSLLQEDGATVNHKNAAGSPLICQSAAPGHVRAVKFLLEKGADPNSVGAGSFSALHLAVMSMNEECVTALVDAGAKLDQKDEDGRIALDFAEMGQLEVHAKIAAYLKGVMPPAK